MVIAGCCSWPHRCSRSTRSRPTRGSCREDSAGLEPTSARFARPGSARRWTSWSRPTRGRSPTPRGSTRSRPRAAARRVPTSCVRRRAGARWASRLRTCERPEGDQEGQAAARGREGGAGRRRERPGARGRGRPRAPGRVAARRGGLARAGQRSRAGAARHERAGGRSRARRGAGPIRWRRAPAGARNGSRACWPAWTRRWTERDACRRAPRRRARDRTSLAAGAEELSDRLNGELAPGADQLAAGLREGQAQLNALRVPAQVTENQIAAAQQTLQQFTTGAADPLFPQALQQVTAALTAARGAGPYGGLDASIGQAAAPGRAGSRRRRPDRLRRARRGGGRQRHQRRRQRPVGRAARPRIGRRSAALGSRSGPEPGGGERVRPRPAGGGRSPAGARRRGAQRGRERARQRPGADRRGQQPAGRRARGRLLPAPASWSPSWRTGATRSRWCACSCSPRRGRSRRCRDLRELQRKSPGFFRSGFVSVAAVDGARRVPKENAQFLVDANRGGSVARLNALPGRAHQRPAHREGRGQRAGDRRRLRGEDGHGGRRRRRGGAARGLRPGHLGPHPHPRDRDLAGHVPLPRADPALALPADDRGRCSTCSRWPSASACSPCSSSTTPWGSSTRPRLAGRGRST